MKIVVTGSLGNISQPLMQILVQQGHSVTVVSNNAARQKDIIAAGAQAAIGSVLDATFLTNTFTGADAVYCMVPPNYAHPDQLGYYESIGNVYDQAIRRSGVKRVVNLSSYGAHLPSGTGFISGSYQIEQMLNAIPGIALTHFRPSYFYYNLLSFISMIKTAGFIGAVYGGEDKLTMVSPKDIAAALAEELVITAASKPVRYVASDDRTCNEVASVLGKAIGKPDMKWLILPGEDVLKALVHHGMPEGSAHKLIELGEAIHNGKLREDYDRQKPALGSVRLEEYAPEFARAFNSK